MSKLLEELKFWGITPEYNFGRIQLTNGDNNARLYYCNLLLENPEFEIALILEIPEFREYIEERAAIREADGLLGDLESAVKCNFY